MPFSLIIKEDLLKACSYKVLKVVEILLVFPIQVEHIIREEKMMAAQEIIELFCELITVRLPIIEAQRCIFALNFRR